MLYFHLDTLYRLIKEFSSRILLIFDIRLKLNQPKSMSYMLEDTKAPYTMILSSLIFIFHSFANKIKLYQNKHTLGNSRIWFFRSGQAKFMETVWVTTIEKFVHWLKCVNSLIFRQCYKSGYISWLTKFREYW